MITHHSATSIMAIRKFLHGNKKNFAHGSAGRQSSLRRLSVLFIHY
jgi:hypothetical protein